MVAQTRAWENRLLTLAGEAWHVGAVANCAPVVDEALLKEAYAYCDVVTAEHSRSFYMASGLLPEEKRRAVRALYAFCRITDDIVDCPQGDMQVELEQWRQQAFSNHPRSDNLAAIAWADARLRYQIPMRYAEQLVEGVSRDMRQDRYETFEDLATYSYGVASTVGLMSMHIIGFSGADALPFAIKLGLALQMTNILRDVGEDWRRGRLYLPLEELAHFDLTEADIAAGVVDDRWRAFMRFQLDRTRQLYEEAWPGIGMLHKDGRFAIAAAAGLYRAILPKIEANDYDVFNQRAFVSTLGKLRLLPGLWRRSRH
ncbi:MAG: squalene/phytoene synthase family protein [Chloroflexi bacterium]|jgi:phytoene synthase|nr:squalene/phytoene synthase family protein [Chloroflexota bacterium]MBK6712045.1 squalene/phytoene synthase family protein [Chloroflexota bacterium]MBK7177357.1 squalene/phytoene synthase family protein [Chloroflexota bacterium]MBK7919678.1 squalene/phytoene synthase family protein [Chloroflexota bacterium]MBK8932027.1 squalene/phytoene synthase family protein [Chloroflexota bacterium]